MMNTEKKVTKRERFNQLIALVGDNEELKAFLDHEIELLDKKNAKDKKPTANQKANEDIKTVVLDFLADCSDKVSITDIVKGIDGDYTNQKISALVRQLITEGKVQRIEEKRKAYFSLV